MPDTPGRATDNECSEEEDPMKAFAEALAQEEQKDSENRPRKRPPSTTTSSADTCGGERPSRDNKKMLYSMIMDEEDWIQELHARKTRHPSNRHHQNQNPILILRKVGPGKTR